MGLTEFESVGSELLSLVDEGLVSNLSVGGISDVLGEGFIGGHVGRSLWCGVCRWLDRVVLS
jgi:hypothetical protein